MSSLLPWAGALLAAALIFSRSPDSITHPQFWAEDGSVFFATVYNHGLFGALGQPASGYLQTLFVLGAGLATLAPLAQAPLVMNLVGVAAQVLPVGLLLSRRAARFAPDLRARALLALLYVGLPEASEMNGKLGSAQWHWALAALLVLSFAPARSRAGRVFDVAVLVLAAISGPFFLLLVPLALALRRWRGAEIVPWRKIGALAAGSVIQFGCLLAYSLSHRASGRPPTPLGATPHLFWRILDLRVFAVAVVGHANASALHGEGALIAVGLAGLLAYLVGLRRGPAELRTLVLLGVATLLLGLVRPTVAAPAWERLATASERGQFMLSDGGRYFVLPQVALAAVLIWVAAVHRLRAVRLGAAGVVALSLAVAVPSDWSFPPMEPTGFAQSAAVFARAPAGTRMSFEGDPYTPGGRWTTVLVKH